jgi:PHD/YefM family antitoxin component YafN of YafNO toxin-antitoxin module/nucleoid DNA-binding protein
MPEELTSISDARQKLPTLSQTAEAQMNRYVITLQGKPQSVLLGYKDYQGLKAAADLLGKPQVAEDIAAGLKEIESGKRLTMSEVRKHLNDQTRASAINDLAAELGGKSGVDAATVATVMGVFCDKLMSDLHTSMQIEIPGVGTLTVKNPGRKARRRAEYWVMEPSAIMQDLLAAGLKK